MRAVSNTYKQIIASGETRNFHVKITMTLADGTQYDDVHNPAITEADIMDSSFKILTASSGQSSFDIGSAIIGKCQFTLKNFNDEYAGLDFFNAEATVWLKLVGDENYHRMGFFTVDEPQYAGSMVSLELLDNMWKFDKDLPSIPLPQTIGQIVNRLCTHCGVGLGTQTFNGSAYQITELPDTDMNCRELLQYLAMIGCNFCQINDNGSLDVKWYDTASYLDPEHGNIDDFAYLFTRNVGTDELTITGIKIKIGDQDYLMGNEGYVLVLENPLVNENNVSAILSLIWNRLHPSSSVFFKIRTFNITALPDLAPEVGDCISFEDKDGTTVYSYLTNFTFTPSLVTASLGAVTPTRALSQRYSKAVQAAVEVARQNVREQIGIYDLSAQRMNQLAINAMGGYTDYDDLPTGGRVYYLSNAPITKNATTGLCEFPDSAIVYKTTGEGFFISPSNDVDPQTHARNWRQGYTPSTGLVVELLTALRINCEQLYTGVLEVGGSQIGVTKPYIRVLDASDNVVCTINHQGIIMGSGYIASSDFEDKDPVDVFSLHGMKIDVNGKYIKSPHFGFNEQGAYFDGEVNVMNHPITVRGDIELYNGSENSFYFAPYDYRLSDSFLLTFYTATSSMTVTIEQHTHGSSTPTVIETVSVPADTETTSSYYLSPLVGQIEGDYYIIRTNTSTGWSVTIDDAILAYMGEGGFRGFMQGIFEGYIDSRSGVINGLRYWGEGWFEGDGIGVTDPSLSVSSTYIDAGGEITRHYLDENDQEVTNVAVWSNDLNAYATKENIEYHRNVGVGTGNPADPSGELSPHDGAVFFKHNGTNITNIFAAINGQFVEYVPSGGGGGGGGINYSTTEQYTGLKWIDGKNVYQLSFPHTSVNTSGTSTIDITNVNPEMIISFDLTLFINASGMGYLQYPIPFYADANNYCYVRPYLIFNGAKTIYVFTKWQNVNYAWITGTIRYTKDT